MQWSSMLRPFWTAQRSLITQLAGPSMTWSVTHVGLNLVPIELCQNCCSFTRKTRIYFISGILKSSYLLVILIIGAISAQDGSRPIWGDVEQQHARLADGGLPLPNDQDPAAVEWETLHGLCQQSEGGGKTSTCWRALNNLKVVPSQFLQFLRLRIMRLRIISVSE